MFSSSIIAKSLLAAGATAALAGGTLANPAPARASTQDTINTAAGIAAVVGGIVLYNNYLHKRQAAHQVVGYTRNGGTIYGDGRIVMPNGQTYYPGPNNQYPGGQYAYYDPRYQPYGYNPPPAPNRYDRDDRRYYAHVRHDNGEHRGWYKHGDDDDQGNGRGHDRDHHHDRD